MKKRKWIFLTIVICFIFILYLIVTLFFFGHFFPGTELGGYDLSLKSIRKTERMIRQKVLDYRLTVKGCVEGEDIMEDISGKDISLTLQTESSGKAISGQNSFMWPLMIFNKSQCKAAVLLKWDEEKLIRRIDNLYVIAAGKAGAVSSYPVFDGEKYIPSYEKYGVQMDKTIAKIKSYIENLENEINLMEEECLVVPEHTSDSAEVNNACREMNLYCGASVTYMMDVEVTVGAEQISQWITCNSDYSVSVQEDKVRQWMREFGEKYDTKGKKRTLVTPWNKIAEVSGGTYGWEIDEETETRVLLDIIRRGETVEKQPACVQEAAAFGSEDWGETYLEVDLAEQYMWFIKDGNIALETNVVTGKPEADKETPTGVYDILYTQKDAILVGAPDPVSGEPIYKTHVRYWMPFTQQGHGFHDADWQTAFGGQVYLDYGSHGCVNMPVDQAEKLYQMLETGTPVIIHD